MIVDVTGWVALVGSITTLLGVVGGLLIKKYIQAQKSKLESDVQRATSELASSEQQVKAKLALDQQAAQHYDEMFDLLKGQIDNARVEIRDLRVQSDVKITEIVTKLDECTKKHAEGERDRGRLEGRVEELSRRQASTELAIAKHSVTDSGAQPIINLTVEKHDTPLEPPPGALIIE